MKLLESALTLVPVMLLAFGAFTGCESTDDGSASASGSAYYGVGFYDPWYYGGYDDDADIIVTPPTDPDRPVAPPRPAHPIARPPPAPAPAPRPMPSMPSMPRPSGRR